LTVSSYTSSCSRTMASRRWYLQQEPWQAQSLTSCLQQVDQESWQVDTN
jgi:hypothetical protein